MSRTTRRAARVLGQTVGAALSSGGGRGVEARRCVAETDPPGARYGPRRRAMEPSYRTDPDGVLTEELSKGSVFRGYCAALRARNLMEPVRARVAPATRELLDHPPPLTAWVSGRVYQEIADVLASVADRETLRAVGRDCVERGPLPIAQATINGLLRLFGTSPVTLLQRLPMLAGALSRGTVYRYLPGTLNAGVMEVTYVARTDLSRALLELLAGSFEAIPAMCGRRMRRSEIVVVAERPVYTVQFRLEWD